MISFFRKKKSTIRKIIVKILRRIFLKTFEKLTLFDNVGLRLAWVVWSQYRVGKLESELEMENSMGGLIL